MEERNPGVPSDSKDDDVLWKDNDRHLLRQGAQDSDHLDGVAATSATTAASATATAATAATRTDRHSNRWVHAREEISFHRLVQAISKFRRLCGTAVNHDKVQICIVSMIAINAIMMGVATFDFVTNNPAIDSAFENVDLAFLIVFTIELSLQLMYHGLKLFLDGWLVFDFIVIVASWSLSSAQIIRAFRIFRALRLVTRVKMMKNLVLAVFNVMPKMAAIGLLLALIFYIFAVMMTQMFKNLYEDGLTAEDYFSNLPITFFTLFQMMTLDNWADIARQVVAVYFWAWIPIFFFVTISGFVVVNLIIAVICDAVSSLEQGAKAKIHGSFDEDDSQHTREHDLRTQLAILEQQVDELSRIQEGTLHKLTTLTRQLQNRQYTTSSDVYK